jgi:hypothetical protein
MVPPATKPVGFSGPSYCKRRNCPGVCPAKVVAQKYGTGKRAKCRVCEQEYTLPPGSADLSPTYNKPKPATPQETNQVKQLKLQNAHLKTLLGKSREETPEEKAKVSEESVPKQSVAGLQTSLESLQAAGASKELLASVAKELAAAKEAAKPKAKGDPCTIILGKLRTAKSRLKQLEEQFKKDLEKVSATKLKLVEASKEVAVTEKQKVIVFKEHGHNDAAEVPVCAPAPPGSTPAQCEVWKQFCEQQHNAMQNAMQQFFGEVFQAVAEETAPKAAPVFTGFEGFGNAYPSEFPLASSLPLEPEAMDEEKDKEEQGRAKTQRGPLSLPLTTAENLEEGSESPPPGNVGTQVAVFEAKKNAGATASKRAYKDMESGQNGNANASSSHKKPETICINDGDDDEDDKAARKAVDELERAIKCEINASASSNAEDKSKDDDEDL